MRPLITGNFSNVDSMCSLQEPKANRFHKTNSIGTKTTSTTMNYSKLLRWLCLYLVLATTCVESYLGVNWGRMSNQRMIPSMVVDMLLQNGIRNVKLFSSSANVLEAFAGTGIEVAMTIPNDDLKNITNVEEARDFLRNKLAQHEEVEIRYISVGTQPLSSTYFNKTYYHAVDALKHLQSALREAEFANRGIKATMSHFTDVLKEVKKPSEGEFREDIRDYVVRSCQLLYEDNAPVWFDIFPIYNVKILFNNDIEFAFFDNNSTSAFMDGDNRYNNIFEVMFDTFITALRKVGLSNMTIVAGQVGWPTDGIEGADTKNAQRFHKGFIRHILNGKGTPLHRGPIDAYVHNLADESKLTTIRGGFMRHWGVYKFDGRPKYNLDFSGQDRDIKPVTVKGITHMPKRWCVFNNKSTDMEKIKYLVDRACNESDCTSMNPGGSCSHLQFPHNISYAFNIFFQSKSQKVSDKVCDFEGLGVIVPNDPSTGSCSFPVEILSAEVYGGNGIEQSNAVRHISVQCQKTICLLFCLVFLLLIWN